MNAAGKHMELQRHISFMKTEHSDLEQQAEKLQETFDKNQAEIEELLLKVQAEEKRIEELQAQVHAVQEKKLRSGQAGRRASDLDTSVASDVSHDTLAFDLTMDTSYVCSTFNLHALAAICDLDMNW